MDLVTIYDMLEKGGPVAMAAVFAWMWWLERKERQSAQTALLDLSNATIKTLTRFETVLEQFEVGG